MTKRIEPFLAACLVIFLASLVLWLRYPAAELAFQNVIPGDFAVYLRAWERVSHGLTPYVPSDPSPYKYSPGVLTLFWLLPPGSPPGVAWFAFGTASVLAFAVSLLVGVRYQRWRDVVALLAGLALSWKGILETLDYGQLEILILGMAVLATASLRKSAGLAGFLAGTLPWLKLPWVGLLLPLLLTLKSASKGRFSNFLAGYLGACVFWGVAAPALLFGPDRALRLSQQWVELLKTQPPSLYLSDINQSAWASAWRAGGGTLSLALVGIIAVAVLLRLAVLTSSRTRAAHATPLATISPWLLLVQLLNPLSWRWGSVFAVGIPFAVVNRDARWWQRPMQLGLGAAVLLLWALQQNPVVHALGYAHWTELHHLGVITLYWFGLLVLVLFY
jgi:hypothetical protein